MKIIYLIWVVLLISTSLVDWTDSQITSIGLAFSPALAGIKLLGLAGLAALAGSGGNSNQGHRRYSRRRSYSQNCCGSYGSRHRYGRAAVEENNLVQENLIMIDHQDVDDCVKKYICELNAKNDFKLDNLELYMKNTFGGPKTDEAIDYSKPSVKIDLAAMIGRSAGFGQCEIVYGRCSISYMEMKTFIQMQFKKK